MLLGKIRYALPAEWFQDLGLLRDCLEVYEVLQDH